jgi:hypothetical protein
MCTSALSLGLDPEGVLIRTGARETGRILRSVLIA